MQFIVMLAVLISGLAYLGYLPEGAMVAHMPLPVVLGGLITIGMIYVLAKA
ncbi:MAG: hypothetical protein WBO55_05270 [Rhizobiaceae bacterium]